MPRQRIAREPVVINHIQNDNGYQRILEVATTNEQKLAEFQRILTDYEIIGKALDVEEIQSLDAKKVIAKKAIAAYEANQGNPILVEDTSLEMMGLDGRPGTYVKDFCGTRSMRQEIATEWLRGKDRRAVARVLLGMYDGQRVHIREGIIEGTIAESLRGGNGFGWDDMFIPLGETRTFAEMTDTEKDGYSMRNKALQAFVADPPILAQGIKMIPEPYEQELARINMTGLQDDRACTFAFSLECLTGENTPNSQFQASQYAAIDVEENMYFSRYIADSSSPSIGLLLTDVDRSNLKLHDNGTPIIWQYGPERRTLALAQRADFFGDVQADEVQNVLQSIDSGELVIPPRTNIRSLTVESVLGIPQNNHITSTYSFKDLGYKKVSADQYVSRTQSARVGLFNKIGKYARSVFAMGSMPAISGWRDVLVTAAVGQQAIFTHRNSTFAGNIDKQSRVIQAAKDTVCTILDGDAQTRALRNIGAAIGCGNVQEELANVQYLYEHAGVRLFRIYTINSDPRVIETAHAIRQTYGDEVELFVGQITDKRQALQLIEPDIAVDALFFGHGGGRQCTSATNGMAVTTLEEVYSITTDDRFNDTTIAVEGGIGRSLGHLFLLGVDLISYNQQLAHCVIEQGDIYFQHKNGKVCMPYHGSASAPTMIIESANAELARQRLRAGGRTRNVEGKAGYRFFEEKANSMVFYINNFKHYAARTLADLGVKDFAELREFLHTHPEDLIRVVSSQASAVGQAYRNNM